MRSATSKHERQVVRHDDDGDAAFGHALDEVGDLAGLRVAERRGRLVEQQHAASAGGRAHGRPGERDDLALAAREHLDRAASPAPS